MNVCMGVRRISNLSVKKFSREDKEAVVDIILRTKNFNEMDKDVAIELIDHYLDFDDDEYLIESLFENKQIIGYVCYGEASLTVGTYEVYYIAIDENYQGKGFGKYLMNEVEKRLKGKARMILIETSSDDTYIATQKFYEKLGYKEVVRIKDFYKIGDDKIMYEKRFY